MGLQSIDTDGGNGKERDKKTGNQNTQSTPLHRCSLPPP